MTDPNGYQHLERRPGSNYKQLFVKGRRIRAEVLYRQTIGLEPRTPEQVAEDYELPLEVIQDAIQYCVHNEPLLRQERDEELQWIREQGLDKPPHVPADYQIPTT
jgi:uncharacterized protein (DUF433 family)